MLRLLIFRIFRGVRPEKASCAELKDTAKLAFAKPLDGGAEISVNSPNTSPEITSKMLDVGTEVFCELRDSGVSPGYVVEKVFSAMYSCLGRGSK